MNFFLVLILVLVIGTALLDITADILNVRHFRTELPGEFRGVYDPEKYASSLRYQRESTRLEVVLRAVSVLVLVVFLITGGFGWIDSLARSFGYGGILTGLAFAGILTLLRSVLQLPFSLYDTFVIEEKYGFNRTTLSTFVTDLFKGILLSALLGAPVFAGLIYFFEHTGSLGWLWAWIAVTAFQLALTFVAPVLLFPIFNKFIPLAEGELRLSGIFTMDGSKRSTKANAFFAGFGRFRRIVLFDTLVEKHSTEEVVAVLAHEVGHFKRRHIIKSMALSIAMTGVMLFVFSLLLNSPALFDAFRTDLPSTYASLVFIGILLSPIMRLASIFTSNLSRRFEYEADRFAAKTCNHPEHLVSALKKLSMDSFSHLTPHPLKVLLDYSHPPVIERITALRSA
jgi:STE24 endopeptidase